MENFTLIEPFFYLDFHFILKRSMTSGPNKAIKKPAF